MAHRVPLVSLFLFGLFTSASAQADDAELRVVTYVDGSTPRFEAAGGRYIRGPMQLELRFQNINPLCYRYTTNIASPGAAGPSIPGLSGEATRVVFPVEPASLSDAEAALTAVRETDTALEQVGREVQAQTLDTMRAACAAGSSAGEQLARVERAASTLRQKLGPAGAWQQALAQAGAVARGALVLAMPLADAAATAEQDAQTRRTTLERAERERRRTSEALEQASRYGRKPPEEIARAAETAQADAAAAETALLEADKKSAQHRAAPHLVASAERLARRRHRLAEAIQHLASDVGRAQSLLASAPTVIRKQFAAGETVKVSVTRTALIRGSVVAGASTQTVVADEYETLAPILLDIGFGPALTLGENTKNFERTIVEGGGGSRIAAARTEQELILDGMVAFSAYPWGARYLDDTVFDPMQLIPRPMFGLSMDQPFSSIYAGLQIDPIQFVDISGGVRWLTTKKLIGQKVVADDLENPGPTQLKEEVTRLYFVSLTFSTDLFWRWAKRQFD
jgi:hypothetical protein